MIRKRYDLVNIHIFINGTSGQYDYYIEYLDNEMKKSRFFPDFILINDKEKTCLLLEAKGQNSKSILIKTQIISLVMQ